MSSGSKKLRTRKALRAELQRVELELMITRERLVMDKESLAERLRLDYWLRYISEKTLHVGGTVEWIFAGYNFVASLLERYRKTTSGTTTETTTATGGGATAPVKRKRAATQRRRGKTTTTTQT